MDYFTFMASITNAHAAIIRQESGGRFAMKPIHPHIKPLHDAHCYAWDEAQCCKRCGELFAVAQMAGKLGECIDCYARGLDEARAEEADYAMMVRRMR